jgi:hypothetical protein
MSRRILLCEINSRAWAAKSKGRRGRTSKSEMNATPKSEMKEKESRPQAYVRYLIDDTNRNFFQSRSKPSLGQTKLRPLGYYSKCQQLAVFDQDKYTMFDSGK